MSRSSAILTRILKNPDIMPLIGKQLASADDCLLLKGILHNNYSLASKNIDSLDSLLYLLATLMLTNNGLVSQKISNLILEETIKKKIDLNQKTPNNLYPLHYAAEMNDCKTIKRLIEAKANINAGKFSPLHLAVNFEHMSVVKLLLQHGADPLIPSQIDNHATPLERAIEKENTAIATLLLEKKVDPTHLCSLDKGSFLTLSIQSQCKDIFLTFLEVCHKRNMIVNTAKNHTSPMDASLHSESMFYFDKLLEAGASPLDQKRWLDPILSAMKNNSKKVFDKLLPFYVKAQKINEVFVLPVKQLEGQTKKFNLLSYATELKRDDMVKKILVHEIDAVSLLLPLYAAIEVNTSSIAQMLLEKKADPTQSHPSKEFSPLAFSIGEGHKEIFVNFLKVCKERNITLNVAEFSHSPISICISENPPFLDELLNAGASPLDQKYFMLPIVHTMLKGDRKIFDRLLPFYIEAKKINELFSFDPQKSLEKDLSLLKCAITYKKDDMAQELLKNGADPSLPNVFYAALDFSEIELFRVIKNSLLEKKASIHQQIQKNDLALLRSAAKRGIDFLNELLALGLDVLLVENHKMPPCSPSNILTYCINGKRYPQITRLVSYYKEKKISLNTHDSYLYTAVNTQDIDLLKFILKEGFSVAERPFLTADPLYYAMRLPNCDITKTLITHYQEKDLLNKPFPPINRILYTPLAVAIRINNAAAKLLIELKADLHFTGNEFSLFSHAIAANNYGGIKLLLESKQELTDQEKSLLITQVNNGKFSLIDAIKEGDENFLTIIPNLSMIKQKIEKNTLMEIAKLTGSQKKIEKIFRHHKHISFNLLQIAVLLNNVSVIPFLLKLGFDCTKPTGQSPIDLARIMETKNTKKLLQEHVYAQLKKSQPTPELPPTIEEKTENKPRGKIKYIPLPLIHKKQLSNNQLIDKCLNTTKKIKKSHVQKLLVSLSKESSTTIIPPGTIQKLISILTEHLKNLSGNDIQKIMRALARIEQSGVTSFSEEYEWLVFLTTGLHSEKKISPTDLVYLLTHSFQLGLTRELLEQKGLMYNLLHTIDLFPSEAMDELTAVDLFTLLYDLEIDKKLLNEHALSPKLFNLAFKNNCVAAFQLLNQFQFHHQEFKLGKVPVSLAKILTFKELDKTTSVLNSLVHMKFSRAHLTLLQPELLEMLANIEALPQEIWNSLPHLLWSFARLGFSEKDFTDPMKKSLERLSLRAIKNFSVKDLALLLWDLCVMGFKNTDPLIMAIEPTCIKIIEETKALNDKTANQLKQAQLWLEFKVNKTTSLKISTALTEKAPPVSSILHQNVSGILAELIKTNKSLPLFKNEFKIENCIVADMCFPKQKIVVEVDGPDHNAAVDAFKNRLLEKLGYKVIRLSHLELGDNNKNRTELLLNIKVLPIILASLKEPNRFFQMSPRVTNPTMLMDNRIPNNTNIFNSTKSRYLD